MDQVCNRFELPAADRRSFAEIRNDAALAAALARLQAMQAEAVQILEQVDAAYGPSAHFGTLEDGFAEAICALQQELGE